MNIFFLSRRLRRSAKYHCDEHVRKMQIEAAQLLYGVLWKYDPSGNWRTTAPWKCDKTQRGYRLFTANHPMQLWVAESLGNYVYCVGYGLALCAEFTRRYGKIHSTEEHLRWLSMNYPKQIPRGPMTPVPLCINKGTKGVVTKRESDMQVVIKTYRRFYTQDKTFATYEKGRAAPKWLTQH